MFQQNLLQFVNGRKNSPLHNHLGFDRLSALHRAAFTTLHYSTAKRPVR
jgi:hypothetical protein